MLAHPSSLKAFEVVRSPASLLDGCAPVRGAEFSLVPEPVFSAGSAPVRLLVIDSDAAVREACCGIAGELGLDVIAVEDLYEAPAVLADVPVDLVLLDPRFSWGRGLDVLAEVRALLPEAALLVMTDCASVSSAVEAMRAGAGDYLTKPFGNEELARMLRRAAERRSSPAERRRRLRTKLRNQRSAATLPGAARRWRSFTGCFRRWPIRRIRC